VKHTKVVEVPATTRNVVYKVQCDLCGGEIAQGSRHDINEVTVKHRTGSSWPEGGSGEEVGVDMCPSCFASKLVPWLTSQGAAPRTTEWDW
jgi:hypothetical protein